MKTIFNEENIMVYPVDDQVLSDYMMDFFKLSKYAGHFIITPKDAIIQVPLLDGFLLINSDCCYQESDTQLVKVGDHKHMICEVFRVAAKLQVKVPEGDSIITNTVLSFSYTIPCRKLLRRFSAKEPVSLKTFMARRYGYNPRIIANMKELIRILNAILNEK